MKILVVYGNDQLLQRTKKIFDRYACDYAKDDHEDLWNYLKHYDLVFSLHCRKIFPKEIVESVRCINIHPGYLPYNRGMFPHVWSIINGLCAGATIHEMDEEIDHGAVLVRWGVPIAEDDTSETLYDKVIQTEIQMLSENIDDVIHQRCKPFRPVEPSNYNSLEDYKAICSIDADMTGTFKEFYDIVRALSHGKYKNAVMNGINFKLEIL